MTRNPNQRAFTLIELLVVIGLIALVAAGLGVAMTGGNPTATLRSGQGMLSSALAGARGQAALTQKDAEILVEAGSPDDDTFLRRIIIVVDSTTQVGADIILPQGVYVVPGGNVDKVTKVLADGTGTWPNGRVSTFFGSRAERSINGIAKYYLTPSGALSPLGSVTSAGTGGKIVLAPGRLTPGSNSLELEINTPSAARGIIVSKYGVATILSDAESLD